MSSTELQLANRLAIRVLLERSEVISVILFFEKAYIFETSILF